MVSSSKAFLKTRDDWWQFYNALRSETSKEVPMKRGMRLNLFTDFWPYICRENRRPWPAKAQRLPTRQSPFARQRTPEEPGGPTIFVRKTPRNDGIFFPAMGEEIAIKLQEPTSLAPEPPRAEDLEARDPFGSDAHVVKTEGWLSFVEDWKDTAAWVAERVHKNLRPCCTGPLPQWIDKLYEAVGSPPEPESKKPKKQPARRAPRQRPSVAQRRADLQKRG